MTYDVTLAIVGAGLRGSHYAALAAQNGARITAVAEPDAYRRNRLAEQHGVPADQVFADWRELAAQPRLADAAVIATQDTAHLEPAVAFAERGYHLLLEKPMAPHEHEAQAIADAAERSGVMLAVCHVLRYTPYTRILKGLLDEGRIGEVMSIQHLEPIGWWHFAHSYVRGNWRREEDSSSMLLAKACHDVDWLSYLIGRPAISVSSLGGLTHFRPENKPAGAADRCVTCPVEPNCPYSAPRLYLDCLGDPSREFWPLGAVTETATKESVLTALTTGPYGRCVYTSDNDVADQQVVSIEYAGGATATLTAVAFSVLGHRQTRIFGTRGSIEGDGVSLTVNDFVTSTSERITTTAPGASAADGHGGGDEGLVAAFLRAVGTGDRSHILSGPQDSVDSHRIVWAAETARRNHTVESLGAVLPSI
ncbi:Gfo/Idh/MocA family protein [Kribbella sp. NPDC020789]